MRRCARMCLIPGMLCAVLSVERTANSQDQPPGPPRYTFRKVHDPNGIGKFYMGREIAHVMGFVGVDWLERPSREKEEKLSLLVKSLQLKPGMTVADIGAGSGVVSFLLAEHVGPKGSVIAVDVQKKMLQRLQRRMQMLGVKNVVPHLGTVKSPRLKPQSIDVALMVDVYHEFEFPFEMMREISRALKPGGRAVLVEYRREDPTVPIKRVHTMSVAQVKREIGRPELGLKYARTIAVLPQQHIVIFAKPLRAGRQ